MVTCQTRNRFYIQLIGSHRVGHDWRDLAAASRIWPSAYQTRGTLGRLCLATGIDNFLLQFIQNDFALQVPLADARASRSWDWSTGRWWCPHHLVLKGACLPWGCVSCQVLEREKSHPAHLCPLRVVQNCPFNDSTRPVDLTISPFVKAACLLHLADCAS